MKANNVVLPLIIGIGGSVLIYFVSPLVLEVSQEFISICLAINGVFTILFGGTMLAVKSKILPGYFYLISSTIKLILLGLLLFLVFRDRYSLTMWYVANFMFAYLLWVLAEIFLYRKVLNSNELKTNSTLSTEKAN